MVKIVSRKSLGIQPVFDIGVARDHNFLLADGLVASNCFNKSHSTAYGYVTFQTAYLKANYPTEYMAALLTANSGDQDKVQKYISACVAIGITVEPPDINRSYVDFTPDGKHILFGLSAVRNVGQGAIAHLLRAREDGLFQSLPDLCDRLDVHVMNRRALEALIQSGSLDSLNPNRNQLMEHLDLVLDWSQSRARDRASGQGNLFDWGNGAQPDTNTFDSAPPAPDVPDWPQKQKLSFEKELLGFYVSDHPLKPVQRSAQMLAPVNLGELADHGGKTPVSAIVLLSSVKPITTKKGDAMAVVELEDLTGHAEAVIFPRAFERIGHHIQPDQRLMIWGKIDHREDRVQVIIEDAEPVEMVQMVVIELDPQRARDIEAQYQLKRVLEQQGGQEQPAKIPVVAIVQGPSHREFVRFGMDFRVQNPDTAVQALQQAGFSARATALVGTSPDPSMP